MTSVRTRIRAVGDRYRAGSHQPVGGYAAVVAAYAGIVGGASLLARLLGRRAPERVTPVELATMALATQKLSRLLSKDPVTSPLRAPFTEFQEPTGESEIAEDVRGAGVRHAVGELVTCPFCAGVWVATGLGVGLVFAPRLTRLVAATGATIGGADFLQLAYDAAKQALQRF